MMIRKIGISIGVAMIVLAGILAAGWSLLPIPKNVTLNIDGQAYPLRVVARDVQQLLEINQVRLTPYDQVTPPVQTRLTDGLMVNVEHARAVIILDGEQEQTAYTTSATPAGWLAAARLTLQPGDRLYADGLEINADEVSQARLLQIVHPTRLTLDNDGKEQVILAQTATLGQALWQAGLRLRASDRLQPGLSAPAAEGLQASLATARNLTIQTAVGSFQTYSAAQTVGEALAASGFALQGLDYSLPAEDQPLPADGKIRVVKVQELLVSSQTILPYQAEFQADPNTEIDQQSILQAGAVGLEEQRQRVRYEDGIETSRTDEGTVLVRAPQNQITGYGTKLVMHTIDTPDGTIQYWRAITMWATSYHPAGLGGSTTTASGLTLKKGLVAVDRRYIPFYTRLYIPGYGEATAADTGGGVVGRMIDLGYEDQDYVAWHQSVTVYFLWPPPANVVWIYP